MTTQDASYWALALAPDDPSAVDTKAHILIRASAGP